jgi:hypothetical protein
MQFTSTASSLRRCIRVLISLVVSGVFVSSVVAQNVLVLPGNGSTSGNGRAPQGSRLFINTKYLITGPEMDASGFGAGTVSSIGWRWNVARPGAAGAPQAQSVATTGNLRVFLKDTAASATGIIGTFIDTNAVGYTKIIDATISITRTDTLEFSIDVPVGGPGTSPFTVTPGNGVLIIFTYKTTTPLATPVGAPTVFCVNNGALLTYQSQTVNGTTGTSSAFRPETRFGRAAASTDTLLVILQDTTAANARRKADHDTLFTYLPSLVPTYRVVYVDTGGATFPSLTGVKRVLYVESSFDNLPTRYLGASSRAALRAWLNSGTAGDKKQLVMIGADLGYNYDRSGSTSRDTTLSRDMLKYVYRLDSAPAAPFSMTGVAVDAGVVLPINNTPPGGGFYPDGCTPLSGGVVLYRWSNHTPSDTVASVGYAATGYTGVSLFADAREFNGSGNTTGFGRALRSVMQFAGMITEVAEIPSEGIPTEYLLTQNYPNPFNPMTTIQFGLPNAANITLKVYDILGREVVTLAEGFKGAGTFQAVWDGRNSLGNQVSTGVYFYSLVAKPADGGAQFMNVRKMMFLK